MNKVEFIQKWEKKVNDLKTIRNDEAAMCRKLKKSTKEYKIADRRHGEYTYIVSILERLLDDFKNIQQ